MTKRINASAVQRAPSATPKFTGCSAVALQRQPPPSVFLNAKAFSILIRCETGKLSRLAGAGCRLAGFQIPAGAGAAGCDRAADREGREHDHFDLGGHQRALLGDLAVDLEHPDGPEEIAAAIGDMDLRDAEIDGVGIG